MVVKNKLNAEVIDERIEFEELAYQTHHKPRKVGKDDIR